VLDTLESRDGKPHTYDALFHFDAKVKTDALKLVTQNNDAANLTVAARPDSGLTLRVVEGQQDPPQGWLPDGMSKVRPAPVGIFTANGQRREMLYVLAPTPKGAADPVKSVEAIGTDMRSARISFNDGRLYVVQFSNGSATATRQ
jgi:hypothetical protein